MSNNFKYDAFISYRHADLDKRVAEKLHKYLEEYKIPKNLKSEGKRIGRVFRDREELNSSSDLAEELHDALISSRYLIVIASPRVKESKWVGAEIESFAKIHGREKILALLIEGEPNESFPEQLTHRTEIIQGENGEVIENKIVVEPLAADIRADDFKEMNKLLKDEVLRLLAPILGCRYDDLKQRHKERKTKRIITTLGATTAFFVTFGGFSTWQAIRLDKQVKQTLQSQSSYLSDISLDTFKDGDRTLAIYLALQALPEDLKNPEKPYIPEGEYALSKALDLYNLNNNFTSNIVIDGQGGQVFQGMDISKDGTKALTTSNSGQLTLWDTKTGGIIKEYKEEGHLSVGSNSAFFIGEDKKIITLGQGYPAIYDSENGDKVWVGQEEWDKISVSESRKLIATANNKDSYKIGDESKISVINDEGKELYSLKGENDVKFMEFSQDGFALCVAFMDGGVKVINLKENKVISSFKATYESINKISLDKSGTRVAVTSLKGNEENILSKGDGCLQVFNTQDGGEIFKRETSGNVYNNIMFKPQSSDIIGYSNGNKFEVVDILTGKVQNSFTSGDTISDIEWFSDGDLVITGARDGTLRYYLLGQNIEAEWLRIDNGGDIGQIEVKGGNIYTRERAENTIRVWQNLEDKNIRVLKENEFKIGEGAISKDGKRIATISVDGTKIVFSNSENGEVISEGKYSSKIETPYFMGNNLIGLCENKVILIDSTTGKIIKEVSISSSLNASISTENEKIIISQDDEIKVYNKDLEEEYKVTCENGIYGRGISQNGEHYVIESGKGIEIYNLKTRKVVNIEGENDGEYTPSNDGNSIVKVKKNQIKIIDVNLKEKLWEFNASDVIEDVILSENKERVLIKLANDNVEIIDIKTNNSLFKEKVYYGNIESYYKDKEENIVVKTKSNEIIKLHGESLKPLAYVSKGFDISKDTNEIVSGKVSEPVIMKLLSTSELVARAREEIKDIRISEEKKRKNYIKY